MAVGSDSVINRVNTTSGFAQEVIALGGIAGQGVVDLLSGIIPAGSFIITQGSDDITTQSSDFLVTN